MKIIFENLKNSKRKLLSDGNHRLKIFKFLVSSWSFTRWLGGEETLGFCLLLMLWLELLNYKI